MTWLKIDDGFPEHDKVLGLSDRAFRVHMTALCQCAKNLTDGLVDPRRLAIVRAIVDKPITGAVRELVAAGLWIECNGGHLMKDYLHYNPDAETVKRLRRERSDAGRRGGQASGQARAKANGEASASAFGSSTGGSTPSRPVPSTEGFSSVAVDGAEKPWDRVNLREIA